MSDVEELVARAICGVHNENAEHIFQHMRECYLKEASAAIAAKSASRWRPIASAPKDGTKIDLL
jgi:hypothetical protein